MNDFRDYFTCDNCQCKDFTMIYRFSMRFHRVNFSDELIYEKSTEELLRCVNCQKIFTREEIEKGLTEIKMQRRKNSRRL